MFADIGGVPAVITKSEGHDKSFGWGWIFALVIIFLALVFLWGRNDRHQTQHTNAMDAFMPLAAAKMMDTGHKPYSYDYNHQEHWDISRDQLRDYGTLKSEIVENKWVLTREMDQNQFRTMDQMSAVKAEVAASERRVIEKIEQDRYDRVKDERDAARLEASNLRYHWRPWDHSIGVPA